MSFCFYKSDIFLTDTSLAFGRSWHPMCMLFFSGSCWLHGLPDIAYTSGNLKLPSPPTVNQKRDL